MQNPLTSVLLIVLTALAGGASACAVLALRRRAADDRWLQRGVIGLLTGATLGSAVLFVLRALLLHKGFHPLTAHVDGLLLIAALLGAGLLFLRARPRLEGVAAFGLPLLTLILAWAICASAWTYHPFKTSPGLDPAWKAIHLGGVYVGTFCAALGAALGAMFLYVRRRLRLKQQLATLPRLASLESLESLIVRATVLGFALLTLGLVSGLVLQPAHSSLGPGWWHHPKVVLSTAAWLAYALLLNVRFTRSFRGARAAWLAIAGFVLLLATYGVITAMPSQAAAAPPPAAPPAAEVSP